MIVCDRCLAEKAAEVAVHFKKHDGTNRQGREMLRVEMALCEACIGLLMKSFGKMKNAFLHPAVAEGGAP